MQSYQSRLNTLAAAGQLRRCRVVEPFPEAGMMVSVEGKNAINFSSNDYLGLSRDERLKQAAIEAIQRYGTGGGASRLITGTTEVARQLEEAVAAFKQAEAALVFNSGYQANVAILQAILSPGDWVFCDKLNHASLIDGCLLSGARWSRYRHLDLNHLEDKLKKAPANTCKWIVTDSVFSMDGDTPDLLALVELAERYSAQVMVDEAHATGLYGYKRSSGLCEQLGVSERVSLQMGTFSKALGGGGAYVAGSRVLMDTLINRARGFIYSTALSPPVVSAARCAVELVQRDTSMKERLWRNVALFRQELSQAGMQVPGQNSAIVPIVIGESAKTLQISKDLLDAGFLAHAIRPPTVPPGTSRLRITLSAAHTSEQIQALAGVIAEQLRNDRQYSLNRE